MKTRKTAVSIPEQIFLEAEETARRLGRKRSQLYAMALSEFLEKHREDWITEKLDEVYKGESEGTDPVLALMQSSGLSREDW